MANVVLLLDMQCLWDSCRQQYGKRARVNFKLLTEKAKSRKSDKVVTAAFIAVQPDKNQENLVKKLAELGIETHLKTIKDGEQPDFSDEMIAYLATAADSSDAVVVGGSGSYLHTVLKEANALNKKTMLLAFAECLNKELAQEADDIRLLTKADTITQ